MFLPMILNAKTGIVGLRPDPKPKTKHWTEGTAVRRVREAVRRSDPGHHRHQRGGHRQGRRDKDAVDQHPAAQPVVWTGTRGFVATKAECDGVIFLADTRPA
jgi:hypothetical protein